MSSKNTIPKKAATKATKIVKSKRQKILIIAHNHPSFFPGGGEIAAYRMFEEIKRAEEYDVLFLAATDKNSREAHCGTPFLAHQGRKDEYLFFCDGFDYFNQSLRNSVLLYRDFAQFLREHQPDIINFHHVLRLGVEALQITRNILPNCKIIYTLHDFIPMCYRDGQMLRTKDDALCEKATPARCHECYPDISSARFKAREMWIKTHFSLVDKFVSPSHFLANRFLQWGLEPHKMQVIDNGFANNNVEIAKKSSPKSSYNRFGFFGQISPYKGTMLILQAAQMLQNEGVNDFVVHIHGNITLQTQEFQENFALELKKCAGNVQFHGVYQQHDMADLIAEIDWVVMPSVWWENAPLVIAEAQHYGKPVICSDIGGMAEKVENGKTGIHFRAKNAQSLKEVMLRAINEPQLWQNLAANITQPTTIEQSVANYLDCIS